MKHRTTLHLTWPLYAEAKSAARWLGDHRVGPSSLSGLVEEALRAELYRLAKIHRGGEPWPCAGTPPPVAPGGSLPLATRHAVLRRDHHRCRACGVTSSHARLHVDHIEPLSLGGGHTLANLQTLCERCNLGKGITREGGTDESTT